MERWSVGRSALINTLVTVALVTVFSTGSAAAALVVKSVNIVDGEVKTVDLANAAVTTAKLAADAVTGAKVNESTLGIVPNANLLDGKDSTQFVNGPGRVITGSGHFSWGTGVYAFFSTVADDIGFNIVGRCDDNSSWFTNETATPWDVWIRVDGGDPVFGHAGPRGTYPNDSFVATAAAGPHLVTMQAVHPATGRQVLVELSVRGVPPPGSGGFGDCWNYVTATLSY